MSFKSWQHYSSTSSTLALRPRRVATVDGVEVGSAEDVVAEGTFAEGAAGGADAATGVGAEAEALDFLLDFLLFLVCRVERSVTLITRISEWRDAYLLPAP